MQILKRQQLFMGQDKHNNKHRSHSRHYTGEEDIGLQKMPSVSFLEKNVRQKTKLPKNKIK